MNGPGGRGPVAVCQVRCRPMPEPYGILEVPGDRSVRPLGEPGRLYLARPTARTDLFPWPRAARRRGLAVDRRTSPRVHPDADGSGLAGRSTARDRAPSGLLEALPYRKGTPERRRHVPTAATRRLSRAAWTSAAPERQGIAAGEYLPRSRTTCAGSSTGSHRPRPPGLRVRRAPPRAPLAEHDPEATSIGGFDEIVPDGNACCICDRGHPHIVPTG
jgi:hypothetical protein